MIGKAIVNPQLPESIPNLVKTKNIYAMKIIVAPMAMSIPDTHQAKIIAPAGTITLNETNIHEIELDIDNDEMIPISCSAIINTKTTTNTSIPENLNLFIRVR